MTNENLDWQSVVADIARCDARELLSMALDRQMNTVRRAAACFVIGQRRERCAVDKLIGLASDPVEVVSITAIQALVVTGSKRATRPLLRLASNAKSLALKTTSISGLGFLGDSQAEGLLRSFLRNESDIVRSVSASALSGLSCRKATIDALVDRLHLDLCPRVRWAAALTLGNVAGAEVFVDLERHLKDDAKVEGVPDQPQVANGVLEAMVRLSERGYGSG